MADGIIEVGNMNMEYREYAKALNGSLSTTPRAVGAQWLQFIGVGKTSNSFNIALRQPVRIG